jgi:hypothetical protein
MSPPTFDCSGSACSGLRQKLLNPDPILRQGRTSGQGRRRGSRSRGEHVGLWGHLPVEDAEQTFAFIAGLHERGMFSFQPLVDWLRQNISPE